jgi:hypothetical protein
MHGSYGDSLDDPQYIKYYIEDIMFILHNKNKITFVFHRKAQAATRGCQAMDQLG